VVVVVLVDVRWCLGVLEYLFVVVDLLVGDDVDLVGVFEDVGDELLVGFGELVFCFCFEECVVVVFEE